MTSLSFALSILTGVLLGVSFPPYNLHHLAWVALVPLLLVQPTDVRRAFGFGCLAGFIANAIIFWWLWPVFRIAQLSWATTLLSWLALSGILSLYVGFFSAANATIRDHYSKPFLLAAVWVALEHVKSLLLTGFPWALLSHTQAYNLPLIQIASITGAPGVSFLLVLGNGALATLLSKRIASFVGAALLILSVVAFGFYRLSTRPFAESQIKVALLQGNIDQYQKWDDAHEEGIQTRYAELVTAAAVLKPDLIVWPESAVPGWFPNEKFYDAWVRSLVAQSKTTHLVGSVTKKNGKEMNSAFLLDPTGRLLGEYDKHHLVPFGEYIPFGNALKRWVPYLGQLGIFDAGEGGTVLKLGEVNLAPNICYEAMFPNLVRAGVQRGGQVLLNITNDGWFLKTGAPEQHYVTNIFRAVENGRPVVRAANTGISAIIDARGRQQLRSSLMITGLFAETVDVPSASALTFFSRHGSWFSFLCWGVCALFGLIYFRACRKNSVINSKN